MKLLSGPNCEIKICMTSGGITRTSSFGVSFDLAVLSDMQPRTSSSKNASAASMMSRMRKTRTLWPFSDKMNNKRSSVAETTALMSNDFHPETVENLASELEGSVVDSAVCSDIAAICMRNKMH